ncbi:MAG: hypothetical protein ACHQNT_09080, partial [Bacteroidia bacterium]
NTPPKNSPNGILAGCSSTTAQKDLDINNVRTRILVGGDMWWDLTTAQYEVPKGSQKHSVFAGALWIGGVDAGGQVKVAGQTYRQTGFDFWGGPMDVNTVSISNARCLEFDRHWRLRKADVLKYIADPGFVPNPADPDEAESKQSIAEWPGNGRYPGEDQFLAPFFDENSDGNYDPNAGDYPHYLISRTDLTPPRDVDYGIFAPNIPKVVCNDYIFGDQTIWWVFNDVGNVHSETNSTPIGMEIRAQAFAFKTNDEINDMTFYKYQIINRSTFTLTNTYFGQWIDPDLGWADDDFVGCDVKRGLGFVYNGDADDDINSGGYGLNPPALGVDFFQGPSADVNDGIDNDKDGCPDCTYLLDANLNQINVGDDTLPEQIIMAKFVYYNNDFSPNGNPVGFDDYYKYLKGIWRDGILMTHTCSGRSPGPLANYMFPGDLHGGSTDPDFADDMNESSCGNTGADRRFLQSAGAFTLQPGAVNYITTGLVWRKASQGGPLASVDLVKLADDKAQALFDNCFKVLDGPDAPDLVFRELDKEVILSLQNTDNEFVERYAVTDKTLVDTTLSDEAKKFKFQGYQIYQVKDATVAVSDLKNPDKARLLFQCDVKDTIARIVNYTFDPSFNSTVPTEEVSGGNEGISHTFKIDRDLFATGSTQLVNHKTYFYTAVSYAYNNYQTFKPDSAFLGGQNKPYLRGRNNIKTYTAIPHITTTENNGTVLNSEYGDGPVITRIEGQGNGGQILDLTQSTIDELMGSASGYRSLYPKYQGGSGPINVKVYDPMLVKGLNFENRFSGITDSDRWTMIETGSSTSVKEDTTLNQIYEQVFAFDHKQNNLQLNWGISANIHNVIEAGKPGAINNAFLEATIEYTDNSKRWLNSLKDVDGTPPENWILSGTLADDYAGDDDQIYEGLLDGTWAPVKLANNKDTLGVRPSQNGIFPAIFEAQLQLSPGGPYKTGIASVDIVITNDRSKWSRAAVIETGAFTNLCEGNALKWNLRKAPSVDKSGQPYYDNNGNINLNANSGEATLVSDSGMSWFPGYAYNLETGERLNIAFGENSSFIDDNGRDMKWNPSSRLYRPESSEVDTVFGGMHYIWIFGHNGDLFSDVPNYDHCQVIFNKLDSAAKSGSVNSILRKHVWKDAMWTTIPIQDASKEFLAADVTIRLRVARTYRRYNTNLDAGTYLTSVNTLTAGTSYYVISGNAIYGTTTYQADNFFTVPDTATGINLTFTGSGLIAPTLNGANPLYRFGTSDLAASLNNLDAAKDALDLINIVPNPYYAYSAYEGTTNVAGQLDNRVKITNLPPRCTVSIFTMNGKLIRRFQRDVAVDNSLGGEKETNSETAQDWDLKNTAGITIGSGIYLIHVEAPGLGERTLKWFGVLRPIDLDSF